MTEDDDIKTNQKGGSHLRRTSSVRLSKDWIDQIVAEPDDNDGDDDDADDGTFGNGGGGGGAILPSTPECSKKKEDILVLLDNIAFFPLPSDIPNSPSTTSNRRRLSSFGVGDDGGAPIPPPDLPVPSAVASNAISDGNVGETAAKTSCAAAAATLPATDDDSKKEVISSPPKEDDDDSGNKTMSEIDDLGRSTHSELTAGGIWEDVPMAGRLSSFSCRPFFLFPCTRARDSKYLDISLILFFISFSSFVCIHQHPMTFSALLKTIANVKRPTR